MNEVGFTLQISIPEERNERDSKKIVHMDKVINKLEQVIIIAESVKGLC